MMVGLAAYRVTGGIVLSGMIIELASRWFRALQVIVASIGLAG